MKDLAGSLLLPAGAPAATNEFERLAQLLDGLAKDAQEQSVQAESLGKEYDEQGDQFKAFYRKHFSETDAALFESGRSEREGSLSALVKSPIPGTAALETTYRGIVSAYLVYLRSAAATTGEVSELQQRLDRARTMLDEFAKAVIGLQSAQAAIRSAIEYLKTLKDPEWDFKIALHPDRNAKLAGSLSCSSDISGKPSLDPPIVYNVVFQNTPRLSLTAGVLVWMLERTAWRSSPSRGGRRQRVS